MENGVNRFVYEQEIKTEEAQPLQSFVNIIRKHEEVQRLLVTWIDDASKCQNDVQSKISGLKNYTRKGV